MCNDENAKSYSMTVQPIEGDTNTGLDQLVDYIFADNGLAGANLAVDIAAGAEAANAMNNIIVKAIDATKAFKDWIFSEADVVAMNQYILGSYGDEWIERHGDDEDDFETGFHLVQNDGSNLTYRGNNLINTVADGIYHIGFEIVDGQFLNEDGNKNATVEQVTSWLNQFYTDHSTTDTGLDRITNLIMADAGLDAKIPESEIEAGANAADSMNNIIIDAMTATGANNDNYLSTDDLILMNQWIRSDEDRLDFWTELHGDDERDYETGYHLVQNDGANTYYFGKNLVNTVADGIYHMGFEIVGDRFLNEDRNENAYLTDVRDWINYFYVDQSDTGTGLDKIVDIIKSDARLARCTSANDINQGADYANQFNHLILKAIDETDAMADGWITNDDLITMNHWIRSDEDRLKLWTELHGDDENGQETGYHLVQNDGANTQYFGKNLVNTVADGIYHMGFEIVDGRFLNEDGNKNAYLTDVAAWLNYFYKGVTLTYGTNSTDVIQGGDDEEHIEAKNGDDQIDAGRGDDLVNGGSGNDAISGGDGDDILIGGRGDDTLNGGDGSDTYRITGNKPDGWSSFQGFDSYTDTGDMGTDTIVAISDGNVDIGMKTFSDSSGIEVIDGTGTTGTVRLLGDYRANAFDFSSVELKGNDIVIDGDSGNDTIIGSDGNDTIVGGRGDDTLNGGDGSDTYRITGNKPDGWSSFQGYDTYADTGADGTDTILAVSKDDDGNITDGNVDIGLKGFGASSGIETIDGTGTTGIVRLLGYCKDDILDFSGVELKGNDIVIDGDSGNDTIIGSDGNDTIVGGRGDDTLNGGDGSDTYQITGNKPDGWSSFQGYDTYADTGADGTDTILAVSKDDDGNITDGNVDIGLKGFGASSGIETIDGTGTTGIVRLLGYCKDDILDFSGVELKGNDIVIDGDSGNDTIIGSDGNDTIVGGRGDDTLNGGDGSDTYQITGNKPGGWSSFQGYDTYADMGADGTDAILAVSKDDDGNITDGNVDIGLKGFGASSGIETIDGTGTTGIVRLLGYCKDDILDFSGVELIGSNIVIDGDSGNDTIIGSDGNDTIVGGRGDDTLNGGDGSDTYQITGNKPDGWSSFQGYDTYADTGADGTDTILAVSKDDDGNITDGNVDIGLKGFDASSGIETIDGTGTTGIVRLLGYCKDDILDFSGVELIGSNIVIDGGSGNDTIYGNASDNTIMGDRCSDNLYGLEGADTLSGGSGNDTLYGGSGVDTMDGGDGADRIMYSSMAFGTDDLETGGSDIVQNGMGDLIDFDALIENVARLQGEKLSELSADMVVGSAIDVNNSFAFVDSTFQIDLNGDGVFQAADDFQIGLSGVSSVTYDIAIDCFMLA